MGELEAKLWVGGGDDGAGEVAAVEWKSCLFLEDGEEGSVRRGMFEKLRCSFYGAGK